MPSNTTNLWDIARSLLALMALALGAPVSIARATRLSRTDQRDILDWLAPLEIMVRKLVLIEALNLPLPAEAAPRQLTRRLAAAWMRRTRKPVRIIDPSNASTWHVSFPLAAAARRGVPTQRSISRLGPPLLAREVWRDRAARRRRAAREAARHEATARRPLRLARRYEAVRRVIADPSPCARRLARRMHRIDAALRTPGAPLSASRETSAALAMRIAFQRAPRRMREFETAETRRIDTATRAIVFKRNTS